MKKIKYNDVGFKDSFIDRARDSDNKRRKVTKGKTKTARNVTYSETKPTGEWEYSSTGPVLETKSKTTTLPIGTKGKEVIVYKRKKGPEGKQRIKKIKHKYTTADAVYKSKVKFKYKGKNKGRIKDCKGPGVACGEGESVTKRTKLIKKKKKKV
tara:strand:- start:2572 stop:3033 length:462 start_codon:yes stop_codon:yes gene_type:complete